MRSTAFIRLLLLLVALAAAENWAVIIAGSNSWYNYRHQSNVAHQYQIYLDYGVKPENIIVFDYDDIPQYEANPFPGELYNLPGDDAKDYYKNLVIDYRGKEITKQTLFNVLLGVEDGSGKKVLKSTSEDNVFINYYDHGAPNLICLINERISSDELQDVLMLMHKKQMYKKLVFYLEACDSATMMEGFPDTLGIYVVTSTDSAVSGWACFCPPEEVVHGVHIGACLSEEYGHAFMEDMDLNGGKDTFQQQFEYIYNGMKKSHPKQWADFRFLNETVAHFFGVEKKAVLPSAVKRSTSFWDTRDNALKTYAFLLSDMTLSSKVRRMVLEEYAQEAMVRDKTDAFFHNLVNRVVGEKRWDEMMKPFEKSVVNKKCYFQAVSDVDRILPKSDYELKYFQILGNLCDTLDVDKLPIY